MRRFVLVLVGLVLGLGGGLALALWLMAPKARLLPDSPTVITQMRDVARLEALDVELYKKISFTPDPPVAGDSTGQNVLTWARYNLHDPHGRAILFAKVHLGLDLQKLDAEHVRLDRGRVLVVLPPVTSEVELEPGETEIIDSNLDSAETARLMEEAKAAFARDVQSDAKLRERARGSAERALRGLLLSLGFREVKVVDALPAMPPT